MQESRPEDNVLHNSCTRGTPQYLISGPGRMKSRNPRRLALGVWQISSNRTYLLIRFRKQTPLHKSSTYCLLSPIKNMKLTFLWGCWLSKANLWMLFVRWKRKANLSLPESYSRPLINWYDSDLVLNLRTTTAQKMWSGSEAGSYLRLIDFRITQL